LKRLWALAVLLLAAACGEESPTQVGGALLPTDAVRTFEIILEPHQYMIFDTAFSQYSDPAEAGFVIAAREFDGGLNANVLARFSLPAAVNVVDTLGIGRMDTVPVFTGATVRLLVDSLRSSAGPVRLAMYRAAETWDRSATWTHRVDTAAVQIPWAVPGGTRGVLVDTATYNAAGDTVTFRLDAATVAAWRQDTAALNRGVIIVAQTPNARLRMGTPQITVQARSGFRPDTLYNVPGSTFHRTFIFTPQQPDAVGAPRVGGTPAWRTVIRLQERLDTLTFACPGVPNCRFRLGQATINHAGLRLQPVPPPAGLRPEGDLVVGAYLLVPSPLLPLQRSPLAELVGVLTVPASSFMAPGAPVAEMSVTEMIRRVAMPPEQWPTGALAPTHLALTAGPDALFGFGAFEAMPRLRLVVSIAQELQLP
jgi:hypothetical protein